MSWQDIHHIIIISRPCSSHRALLQPPRTYFPRKFILIIRDSCLPFLFVFSSPQMKPTKFERTVSFISWVMATWTSLTNRYLFSEWQLAIKSKERLKSHKTKRQTPLLSKADLIHIHKSPNYCVEDPKKGILGTSGRVCNKTSTGSDSCDLLCCGRGYNTQVNTWLNSTRETQFKWIYLQQVVRHVERCFCRFVWCCNVKCKTCVTMIDVHTCK